MNDVLDKNVAKAYNPIVLAYLGDAIHSLYVRRQLILNSDAKAGDLHKVTSKTVSAVNQSKLADLALEIMTEEELDIVASLTTSGHLLTFSRKVKYLQEIECLAPFFLLH